MNPEWVSGFFKLMHNPCDFCYSNGEQKGCRNYCPECCKAWCHMCRLQFGEEKKLFGVVDRSWSHGFYMYPFGPGMCQVFHWCKFTTDKDGKRKQRPYWVWWLLSITFVLLYVFGGSLIWCLAHGVYWSWLVAQQQF